jgi:NAD(P)-dependent dehydrogenase (short-subunit alcohol dehydrogenase family)
MASARTVIITGASSGIGLALAASYLKRGDNVVGNARTLPRLQDAAASLGNPENFLLVDGDIGRPQTATRLFEQAIEAFDRVDILIANAGIFVAKPISEITSDDVDAVINTNLRGFFYPAQAAAAHMSANGSGHIVAITASIGMAPSAKLPASLSVLVKAGLNQAVRALALELAATGVRVNAVAPGVIDTPLLPPDEGSRAFLSTFAPLGRIGAPSDVVDAVQYLTDSSYVTGSIMTVDGGATAGTW